MKPIGSGHKRRPLVADLDRRPRHIIAHCGLDGIRAAAIAARESFHELSEKVLAV